MASNRAHRWLWISGVWVLPLCALAFWFDPSLARAWIFVGIAALAMAPVPALVVMHRKSKALWQRAHSAEETTAKYKSELETVRFRTARMREELRAADHQARLSHQLTLLGQFTAGFLHEFNNPLSIVAGRLEVLLDERCDDAALCADLEQMLKEARYMGRIATTLLQALRRERSREAFEPCAPDKPITDVIE